MSTVPLAPPHSVTTALRRRKRLDQARGAPGGDFSIRAKCGTIYVSAQVRRTCQNRPDSVSQSLCLAGRVEFCQSARGIRLNGLRGGEMTNSQYDIAIMEAGIVGLAMALAAKAIKRPAFACATWPGC